MHACCQGNLEIVTELVMAGANLAAVRRDCQLHSRLSFLCADTQAASLACGVRRSLRLT